ncbi:hypothetical protein O7606_02145 [Micromonospora sp. WMMD882]|uniref:hypothetical protein n=1 Tax=Micromonospora sp. WMMD882 TaxID=3015151 RepID=UPI00248D0AB6|nr:hypothetical protein [Micromonospora sp. WMMD882]WBB80210.1 hypothetical protein O7606_02145 [Micromonospora sp. WMMD882]
MSMPCPTPQSREPSRRIPAADRPLAGFGAATAHTPVQPIWVCRGCGHPWPCGEARRRLLIEYEGNMVSLAVYLCGMLYRAVDDLCRVTPDTVPEPGRLWERFVGWAPYRRPDAS